MFTERDEYWMRAALLQAEQAALKGEVPVGAVLVWHDTCIAAGHNQPIMTCDPTAHAEIIALRLGAKKIENYRLNDTTLYVTLEPCIMCVGAIVHARVKRLVYGTNDAKAGAVVSRQQLLNQPFLNHHPDYFGGLLSAECSTILSQFFQARR